MCAPTQFFFDGFKALQLEDTTAHDAFSVRLALVYLLVVWDPFFWFVFGFLLCHLHFPFLSLPHVLHGPPRLYVLLLFLLRRAHRTRLFMAPLFVCRALSFSFYAGLFHFGFPGPSFELCSQMLHSQMLHVWNM